VSAGRTSWWPKDAAWHRRELIVELGEEFGAEALIVDVLCSWAQEQRATGDVRGGFRTLARETFVTASHALSILQRAAEIGVLDDLELDPDGRRFTCRVSGWRSDAERGRAAVRQATRRNQDLDSPEQTVTDRDESGSVTLTTPHNQTVEKKESVGSARATSPLAATVSEVEAVLSQCPRLHVDRVGVENAIAAWPGRSPVAAAHTVVTWATDSTFRNTNGAKLLGDALSKQSTGASPGRPGAPAAVPAEFAKYDIAATRRSPEAA
jgi:hypothetical protein